jgi:hypothetical protein
MASNPAPRQKLHRVEHDLDDLTPEERDQIDQACKVLRKARQHVSLGTPAVPAATIDIRKIGRA